MSRKTKQKQRGESKNKKAKQGKNLKKALGGLGLSISKMCDLNDFRRAGLVRKLFNLGAEIDIRSVNKALVNACAQGDTYLAYLFLSRGADPNTRSAGQSVLQLTLSLGHRKIARQLVRLGAK